MGARADCSSSRVGYGPRTLGAGSAQGLGGIDRNCVGTSRTHPQHTPRNEISAFGFTKDN